MKPKILIIPASFMLLKRWIESKKPEWQLLELTEDVGVEVKGHDIVIVMERK